MSSLLMPLPFDGFTFKVFPFVFHNQSSIHSSETGDISLSLRFNELVCKVRGDVKKIVVMGITTLQK